MNAILENVTFFILFLTILIVVLRGMLQIHKIDLFQSFYIVYYMTLLALPLVILSRSWIGPEYLTIIKNALGMILFTLMSIGIIGLIKAPNNKKLKTLLRFPLIGLLLAWLLTFEQFIVLFLVIELIQLAIFYKFKTEQYYIFRQQIKVLAGLALMIFVLNKYYSAFYLGFTMYIVMKNQILNGVKLKKRVFDYQKESHE